MIWTTICLFGLQLVVVTARRIPSAGLAKQLKKQERPPTTSLPLALSPLKKINSSLQCLPPNSLNQLNELYSILNKDDLVESLKSKMELAHNKYQQLDRSGLAGLFMVNWCLDMDPEMLRQWTLELKDYMDPLFDLLEKQPFKDLKSSNDTSSDSSVSAFPWSEYMALLWSIGPLTLFKFHRLGHYVNQDGAVDSLMASMDTAFPKAMDILDNEACLEIIMPQVINSVAGHDTDKVYKWLHTGDIQLKKFLNFNYLDS